MPFRFRKSLKIGKGIRVNLSKSGISTSIGKPGASLNIGNKGARVTAGIPGTGLSFSKLFGGAKRKASPSLRLPASTTPVPIQKNANLSSNNQTKKSILVALAATAITLVVTVCASLFSTVTGIGSATAAPTVDLVSVQGTALAEAWLSYTQTFQASITDTPIPTATLLPTETLIPTFTSSPQPTATLIVFPTATIFILIQPTSAPPVSGGCSCGSDTMNCTDFASWSSAQACYTSCVAAGAGDIHRLDGNNDGSACDSLK